MSLAPLDPIDTRGMFRPVSAALLALLRPASPADWQRGTVAGTWIVRDVLAHLLDTTLRRLSFHRDGMVPPPPTRPISSERDFVAFINDLNAQWVTSSKRLSPRVLLDLYDRASAELADWFESQPLDSPALFGVSWAGERTSVNWFDIAREFTELWHHQQQIRIALHAESLADPRYLQAVIDTAVRGLPHAYRDVHAEPGDAIAIDVTGPAGGQWALVRENDNWTIWRGGPFTEAARVRLDDDAAWKLLFNALPETELASAVRLTGRAELTAPMVRARSIVI